MVWIKIRVMTVVPVPRPPTGINRQLGQVGKPAPNQVGVDSGGCAAHQSAKRIEVCRSRALGDQIRVEEGVVSNFIVGVIVDVLIHVFVQRREGFSIVWITSSTWNFGVLDSTEFIVLDPKVGLEYLECRWEPEQGCVWGRETATCSRRLQAR